MDYIIVKALHVVGIVSWFAGLFYMVRLFIYHAEAATDAEPKRAILVAQYKVMQRRLWHSITWPAMVLTAATGGWLLKFFPIGQNPWLLLKFALLAPLFAYHFHCGWIRKRLAADIVPYTPRQLRFYNEVPTFLLVGIVFTAISKTVATGLWSLAGCAVFFAVATGFFLKRLQGRR
jgi:protoporphyrinogen IX oxidase